MAFLCSSTTMRMMMPREPLGSVRFTANACVLRALACAALAVLLEDDDPKAQLRHIVHALNLDYKAKPFSICLECNRDLLKRARDEVRDLVPPYVFKTQEQYMECPSCHRIYWQGTHWAAMRRELERFISTQHTA